MNTHLQIIAPTVNPSTHSEAEIFGMMVWLWMHSNTRKGAPIEVLSSLMLPAIKNQQYVLLIEGSQPVAYVSWAELSPTAETAYLRSADALQTPEDWRSGDRYWITDWIAPFGHTRELLYIIRNQLFPNRLWRSLYHKGRHNRPKIMTFHGIAIHPLEAQHWFKNHPITHPNHPNSGVSQ